MSAIVPVTVFLQDPAGKASHSGFRRALMMAGFAKPMETWNPAGPNSWKYAGPPTLMKESWAFCPSKVLVCSHSSPLAMRSAPGLATTPYLPGIMLAITACPAKGDSVLPSASYFGQVTIMPTRPSVEATEIGQASWLVVGSIVPAKLLDNGMLNMS